MVIKTTRWTVSTCGCIIDYTWDDSVPVEDRVHEYSQTVYKCENHKNVSDKDHQSVLLLENNSKNLAMGWLLENVPDFSQLKTAPDGNINTVIKDGVTFDYEFTGSDYDRVLSVSVSGLALTIIQKTALQSFCDVSFGDSKVLVS